MNHSLPEEFFNITFLPLEKYADKEFLGKRYRIIGEDDVGNYIGEAEDGTVYLLNTAATEEQEAAFARDAEALAAELTALDPEMLRDEFTFWSPLIEEMGCGMI